jgi:2,5-diamino-6-(ribosylamino)-4(3H)-pyrimidinone 5'-phosphate reductase
MPRNREKSSSNKVDALSTHLKDKEEKLQHILERLIEDSNGGTPIIVEGKKDVETLRALGVEGKIISAKTDGKAFLDVIAEVENTGAREIILLLDFDRRGKEMTAKLKQHLEKTGLKLNSIFWRELSSLVRTEVKDVEGLAAYMETLKKKTNDFT